MNKFNHTNIQYRNALTLGFLVSCVALLTIMEAELSLRFALRSDSPIVHNLSRLKLREPAQNPNSFA